MLILWLVMTLLNQQVREQQLNWKIREENFRSLNVSFPLFSTFERITTQKIKAAAVTSVYYFPQQNSFTLTNNLQSPAACFFTS